MKRLSQGRVRERGRPAKSCDNPMVGATNRLSSSHLDCLDAFLKSVPFDLYTLMVGQVGQGVIRQELLTIQLVAFLLAQGNQTYFALSEGWTDVQQPNIDKQRPLEQWAWQPQYDVKYGAPLGPAVVTDLTAMGDGGDQLYRRDFEHCTVSLSINARLGNSSNASIVMKTSQESLRSVMLAE